MNYNRYKEIENWSKEQFLKNHHSKNSKNSQLDVNAKWHDA